MQQTAERSKILLEALPYMKRFSGKMMVIKYGGNAMTTPFLKASVMKNISLLQMIGVKIVLVHGGGPEITKALDTYGIPHEFIDGLRKTSKESMEIITSVLTGKVNKGLVVDLLESSVSAIGLSGIDGGMIRATKKNDALGLVGEIQSIQTIPITMALEQGYIPVIAPVGVDENGQQYNINADTAAVKIAEALKAEKFIMLSDIPGVLRDPSDHSSIISEMDIAQAEKLLEDGTISGGMIPKILAGIYAMKNGLKEMTIVDGRVENALILELFSDEGIGTLIRQAV